MFGSVNLVLIEAVKYDLCRSIMSFSPTLPDLTIGQAGKSRSQLSSQML